jgi:SAM-dependent methyltransferase
MNQFSLRNTSALKIDLLSASIQMIKNIIERLEQKVAFTPTWYGILINPFYITRRQLYLKIADFASRTKITEKILDVGCGAKPYRNLFLTPSYLGIDVKGGGLRDRTKQVDKFFDGKKIPYSDKLFSVCIATEVLEHTPIPDILISEMNRELVPGGKLFVSMPFVWPEHGLPFDFQRFTKEKHAILFKKAGFKITNLNSTTGIFGTVGQLLSNDFYEAINRKVWKSNLRYGIKFLLIRILIILFCFPTQVLFELLDFANQRQGITLDYVVEAVKIKDV